MERGETVLFFRCIRIRTGRQLGGDLRGVALRCGLVQGRSYYPCYEAKRQYSGGEETGSHDERPGDTIAGLQQINVQGSRGRFTRRKTRDVACGGPGRRGRVQSTRAL